MEKLAYIIPLAACLYLMVSCWWVRSFFTASGPQSTAGETFESDTPPVSVLKPVRGLDEGAYENFHTFFHQDYPEYEVLFATAQPDDPALSVIRQVVSEHPQRPATVMSQVPQQFPNPKVSSLAALTEQARYPLLIISDSDIRVDSSYLRRVTLPLADASVGLVTCCYRGVAPRTLTAKLEALHMGVTFLPQVVVARRFLDMHFALGGTIALRLQTLKQVGGWEAVADQLAEDTQLARRVREVGLKVVLSQYIVDCYLGATTWREQWQREVRWARTNRINRPREYPGILLTLPVPLALVLLPLDPAGPWGWGVVGAALVVRWVTAWLITGYTGNRALRRWLGWLPLRDILSALVWCAGVAGHKVVWRGTTHQLRPGGRLSAARGT